MDEVLEKFLFLTVIFVFAAFAGSWIYHVFPSEPAHGIPVELLEAEKSNEGESDMEEYTTDNHPYVGMWVTEDGNVRHELLQEGRYDEARGERESAYQGSYTIMGNHIEYVDDTGFTADGKFIDDVLYHGGMVLYRED